MSYSYVTGFGLQAVYFVTLARVLGPEQYGLFVGALALITTFASVAGLGAGNVLVMETARNARAYRAQLGTAMVYLALTFVPLVTIVTVIVLVSAPALMSVTVPLLFSELYFARMYDVGLQSFQSHERLREVAHINVGTAAIRLAVVTTFAGVGMENAAAWAWCYASVTVVTASAVTVVCLRRFGSPMLNRGSLFATWRVGIYFALGMSSRIVLNDSDKFVLASNGLEVEGGQYGASHRLVNMAFAPMLAVTYSLNTQLFRAGSAGYEAAWRVLRRVLPIASAYAFAATLALWLIAPIAVMALGDDYTLVSQMLPLLALTLFGQTGYYFFGDALMGLGRQGIRSVSQATVGAGVLVANVVLVPSFGWIASAVTALVASSVLAMLLSSVFFVGLRRERFRVRTEMADSRAVSPDQRVADSG